MQSTIKKVIFCTNCGKENQLTSRFCESCGVTLKKSELEGHNHERNFATSNYNNSNNYSTSDYTQEELNVFITKNQAFYLEKFNQISRTGHKKTWNWSAFLATIYWMLYRKMYAQAGLYFLANAIFSFIPVIGWILNLVLWGSLGVFANSLYLDHINKKFKDINCADSTLRAALINKYGGTNMVLPMVLFLAPIVISMIFIFISLAIVGSMYY